MRPWRCLNGFFVVTCDTNPLIVTLGMGTVFTGLIYFLSGSNTITGIDQSLSSWTFTNKWLRRAQPRRSPR